MLPPVAYVPPPEVRLHPCQITEIRGPNVVQIRRIVLRHGGEAAWQELLAKVSEPCRQRFLRPLSLYEWVEEANFTELSLAYMSWAHRDDTFKSGRSAAREELTTLHRWMLRMITPDFLINSLPHLFSLYVRGGLVTVEDSGPGHAQVSLLSKGMFPEWYHPGVSGWLQAALELTGAEGVVVAYDSRRPEGTDGTDGIKWSDGSRHTYRLAWKV